MPSRTPSPRPEPERSATWPPSLYNPNKYKGESGPASTALKIEHSPHGSFFEDDLETNPEKHFLSPIQMYEYEDWAEDSDSDAEEVEWDAGITDFALFDDDRRRAQESNEPLPSKWSGMLSEQVSALERAVQRHRADSDPNTSTLTSRDDVPSLTPDVSPDLRDDLDVESYHGQNISRPSVPNYLSITVTPPDDEDESEALESDEEMPLSFYVARKQLQHPPERKLQRPGLRHTRTMSGQVHAWRRPSLNMYTVGEDSEAEERAEHGGEDGSDDGCRGRR